MKKILIVGAGGQIGSELVPHLRSIYGNNNVVAADISAEKCKVLAEAGPFEELNALDGEKYTAIVKKYGIDTIFNLVALLSATGEKNPVLAWNINIGALTNSLNIAKITIALCLLRVLSVLSVKIRRKIKLLRIRCNVPILRFTEYVRLRASC